MSYSDTISSTIDSALAAGSAGRIDEALHWFSLCRTMLVTRAPAAELKARVDRETDRMRLEADNARAILMARSSPDAETRVTVVSDSLGLPRPEEMNDLHEALEKTYSGQILSKLQALPSANGASIDAHCQRFFTTDDAVLLMRERRESLENAHVLVHLGLNDCAVRMFLPDQRLACDLLPKPVSEKVVGFARTYRNQIIRAFPEHRYVSLERFRANLGLMAELVRRAGGRSLTFCTVIVIHEVLAGHARRLPELRRLQPGGHGRSQARRRGGPRCRPPDVAARQCRDAEQGRHASRPPRPRTSGGHLCQEHLRKLTL